MKLKTLIAVAIAGAFAVPGIVMAQSATSQPRDQAHKSAPGTGAAGRSGRSAALFDRLDRNNDGFISRDEAKDATELQGRFAELDKDNDGKISASEMRALDAGRSATSR